jgi:uncharacterized phiE125 gp8 family phage protein
MWLPTEVITPPAEEPVSIDQARAQVSLEPGDDTFDVELGLYIKAARAHAEEITGTALMTQTLLMRASCFDDLDKLPSAPLQSITSVKYLDGTGVEQLIDPSVYDAVLVGMRPFIRRKVGQAWPIQPLNVRDAIRIEALAGYGAIKAIPDDVRLAMLLMIGEWFKEREESGAADTERVSSASRSLLKPHFRFRGM